MCVTSLSDVHGCQKRASDLEPEVIDGCELLTVWVLGIEPSFSARATSSLNHQAILLAPDLCFLNKIKRNDHSLENILSSLVLKCFY